MHFEPTWESLQQSTCPDWFRDAKFGIWAHWGPQCVPMEGDWYARNMYVQGHAQHRYHCEHYGHPSEFGFKDIISLWRAEKFDPDAMMDLYVKAGAKYFVSMGVHHDNFDLWNSKHHRWNAVNMGPKRDIVTAWREAARKRGLRFGVTEHLERSYSWFNTNKGSDTEGTRAGIPYDGNDPEYADLYFPPHGDTNKAYPLDPPDWWTQQWLARCNDLVDQHDPDLLYTDGAIPFGEVGLQMVAHYYNRNIERRAGRLEAVYTMKDCRSLEAEHGSHGEYRDGVGLLAMERGVVNEIRPEPWETDTCIGGWFYNRNIEYKTAETLVPMLADIVSKNGNLLLNFPQRPDGTLDERELAILAEMGEWLALNGEAIYGTRPWAVYGEGPTRFSAGLFGESEKKQFTAEDIRFTFRPVANGDRASIYAIALGWPGSRELRIRSLGLDSETAVEIRQAALLGAEAPLAWVQERDALRVTLADTPPCRHACVVKLAV